MLANSNWQTVLEEWDEVVRPFLGTALADGVFPPNDPWCSEYSELNDKLKRISLQEINALPFQSFGAIGDSFPVMKPIAVLWLLPVILRFGSISEEPIYARSVISALLEAGRLPSLKEIFTMISADTKNRIYELAVACCELGWQDEKRAAKRIADCKPIFC